MFASNQDMDGNRKDSVRNVELSGQFCWNLATWELREEVNASAEWVAEEVDEFERCGLEKEMVSGKWLVEWERDELISWWRRRVWSMFPWCGAHRLNSSASITALCDFLEIRRWGL